MAEEPPLVKLLSGSTSLDLLRAIYQSPELPLPTRMRAASMAIAYEHPKLAVTAIIDDDGFAERLDRAIARSGLAPKHQPKLIEAQSETVAEPAEPLPPAGPSPTPMAAPFASFRRRG